MDSYKVKTSLLIKTNQKKMQKILSDSFLSEKRGLNKFSTNDKKLEKSIYFSDFGKKTISCIMKFDC